MLHKTWTEAAALKLQSICFAGCFKSLANKHFYYTKKKKKEKQTSDSEEDAKSQPRLPILVVALPVFAAVACAVLMSTGRTSSFPGEHSFRGNIHSANARRDYINRPQNTPNYAGENAKTQNAEGKRVERMRRDTNERRSQVAPNRQSKHPG